MTIVDLFTFAVVTALAATMALPSTHKPQGFPMRIFACLVILTMWINLMLHTHERERQAHPRPSVTASSGLPGTEDFAE